MHIKLATLFVLNQRAILIDRDCMSSAGIAWLSRRRTTKLNIPFLVGVPLMTPAAPLRMTPGGKLPDASDHV